MIRSSKSTTQQNQQHNYNTAQAIHPTAMASESSKPKTKDKNKHSILKKDKIAQENPTSFPEKHHRKVLMKDGKPVVSFASVATAKARRLAFASMARKEVVPLYEGDLPDPYDIHPPPMYDDQVLANPNAKEAIYEEEVILDSRASDCVVPSFACLDLIRNAHHLVTVADGAMHESNHQGKDNLLLFPDAAGVQASGQEVAIQCR